MFENTVLISNPYTEFDDRLDVFYPQDTLEKLIEGKELENPDFPEMNCLFEKYETHEMLEKIKEIKKITMPMFDVIEKQTAEYKTLMARYRKNKRLLRGR
jgi:hypothetical protein